MTATPLEGEPDAVDCEINVALIASLSIQTTVRKMLAHELQWLSLAAHDLNGNAFSAQGLEALEVDWSFTPKDFLHILQPNETRQALEPALAAVDASGRWARYQRIAVRAGSEAWDAIDATAVLRDEQTVGEGRKKVAGRARLSIERSVMSLTPSARAVLAPSMSLKYALRVEPRH